VQTSLLIVCLQVGLAAVMASAADERFVLGQVNATGFAAHHVSDYLTGFSLHGGSPANRTLPQNADEQPDCQHQQKEFQHAQIVPKTYPTYPKSRGLLL
jgi:hypothetical protein